MKKSRKGSTLTKQVDLLSPPVNFAVVQLPERKYPGVVVQGDTLHSLLQQVGQMERLLAAGDLEELSDDVEDLKKRLTDAVGYFERICAERGIELPY